MRQEKISEILKKNPNRFVEVYSTNGAWSIESMHTDNINYEGDEHCVILEQPVLDWRLMGEEDYSSTILANSSTTWAEIAPDEDDPKILVILIEEVVNVDSIHDYLRYDMGFDDTGVIFNRKNSEILLLEQSVNEIEEILADQYNYDSMTRHSLILDVNNVAVEVNSARHCTYSNMSPLITASEEGIDVMSAINHYDSHYIVGDAKEELQSIIDNNEWGTQEEIGDNLCKVSSLVNSLDLCDESEFVYRDGFGNYAVEERHLPSFRINGDLVVVHGVSIIFRNL